MKVAYLDSSVLAAILFDEPGGAAMARKLGGLDTVVCSALLEAELRGAAAREAVTLDEEQLAAITWITPQQPLSAQYRQVLAAGLVRGAELFHLACALHFYGGSEHGVFLTLDVAQRTVAQKLGFVTEWAAIS
ncbi:MAG TPA: PIN domain-containing protein [Longimicrobiales bacterium]